MSAEANVGVVGLAAMGGSLARNLAHHGNKVAVFNRSYGRTEKLMNEHGNEGEFFPAKTLEEFHWYGIPCCTRFRCCFNR